MLQPNVGMFITEKVSVSHRAAVLGHLDDSKGRQRRIFLFSWAVFISLLVLFSLPCISQNPAPKPGPFSDFESAPTYPVPTIDPKVDSVTSIAAGDLNGDGKADAVVGLTDGIAVLLNDGTGHLPTSSTISLVASPTTLAGSYQHVLVAVGDVNGDGKPDIAATVNGNVWVLVNKGDGTFTAPSVPTYSPGSLVISMAIGDVTVDGKTDIVLLLPDSVVVMQGHGDGTFSPFVALNNGIGNLLPAQEYWSDAIGDVNGDGKPDLIASGFVPGVCNPNSLCAGSSTAPDIEGFTENDNAGSGSFGPAIPYPQSVANPYGTFGSIAIADVNGDGLPDIVLGTNNASNSTFAGVNWVVIALNEGNEPSGIPQVGAGNYPQFGNPQLITSIFSGMLDKDLANPIALSPAQGKPLTTFGLSIMALDFNGDGYPDLIVNDNNNGTVFSLQNNRDTTFTTISAVPGGLGMSPLAIADFDGDGTPDVLVANAATNTVTVLLGEGDGRFNTASSFPVLTAPGTTSKVMNNGNAIADFNGDGIPDYVYSDSDGNVHEQVSTASGYKSTDSVLVVSALGGSVSPVQVVLAADFNGDGKEDLLLQYGGYANSAGTGFIPSTFGVALGQADGTFVVPSVLYSYADSSFPGGPSGLQGYVVADVNGDGKSDVLALAVHADCVAAPSGPCGASGSGYEHLVAFLGNGDGTFQPAIGTEIDSEGWGDTIAVGDVTGDGISDVVVSNASGLSVWTGTGTGSFYQSLLVTQTSPGAPAIGDFNGDGANDIAALGPSGITVLFNDGKGNFPAVSAKVVPNIIGDQLHALDVNRDGLSDLVMLSDGSSPCWDVEEACSIGPASALTLLSNGDGTFKSYYVPVNNPDAAFGSFQIRDFNGDGAPDIAVATANELASIYYNRSVANVRLSPASITFASQTTGTSSAAQTVTLTNSGSSAVSITSVAVSGDFAETQNCGSSVAAGASCTISVTFTPTASGTRVGSLLIKDSAAGSPQTVVLSGTGTNPVTNTPAVTLSATSLTFSSEADGSTSAAQSVTLTNSGIAPLSIASITASSNFAETNTCGNTVAAAGNCAISVTFTPTSGGSLTGTITITDNASGSPQTVALTGTGSTVTITPPSTGLTVGSAGSSTMASIQLASAGGFSGTVNLACSVAWQGTGTVTDLPTCSLNPTQALVTSGASVTSTLTINTTAPSRARLDDPWLHGGSGALAALLLFGIVPRKKCRRLGLMVVFAFMAMGAISGCGGGSVTSSSGGGSNSNPGTTAGNYVVTVSGTSGTINASARLPLSVQ